MHKVITQEELLLTTLRGKYASQFAKTIWRYGTTHHRHDYQRRIGWYQSRSI